MEQLIQEVPSLERFEFDDFERDIVARRDLEKLKRDVETRALREKVGAVVMGDGTGIRFARPPFCSVSPFTCGLGCQ